MHVCLHIQHIRSQWHRMHPTMPEGSFIRATADTRYSILNVIPQPPGSFKWTGKCNFKCITGLVRNSHCEDEAAVEMVIVRSKTEINLNNTVEEVCSNLDVLV